MSRDGTPQFGLRTYVNDPTFENGNNPNGNFKMHMYSNMEDSFDNEGLRPGFIDTEIPLKPCPGKE